MKINYNRMIQSNLLSNMRNTSNHVSTSYHVSNTQNKREKQKAGIELQTFANPALASSAQNYTHKLLVQEQEISHLKKQIRKKNKIIGTLSALLIATSITTMLFWVWAIHLRDSIIWHNYTKHNNNIERVVVSEVE